MSYLVLQQISGGGFSDVFEVEDPASALPERLILKRLTSEMSARPEVRTAFADEAKILRELRHPNVVTFRRCYFDEKQRVCLLMEKVAGEPLDAWARRNAAQPDLVLEVFGKVLQAVDYLHHRPAPYLHLDLKPDNVLVSPSPQGPQPVLIDFGIARRSGGTGLKAYTPPYGAPEQQAGGTLDCSTDVHALGQILAEVLEFLPLPAGPVREGLAAVAAKARNASRRGRFADAGDMGLAFRNACRAMPAPTPRPSLVARLPQLSKRALAAGAAGVALALALTVFSLVRSPAAPDTPAEPAPASGEVDILHQVDALLAEALKAASDRKFEEAEERYVEATLLRQKMAAVGNEAREVDRRLAAARSDIDLLRHGGWAGEEVRLNME
jgi:serine/threonine protein kinase